MVNFKRPVDGLGVSAVERANRAAMMRYAARPGMGAADFVTSLTQSPTGGSGIMDFLIGGVVGFAVAPDDKTRYMWAIAGGALTMILGSVGMASVAGAAIWTKR